MRNILVCRFISLDPRFIIISLMLKFMKITEIRKNERTNK
jgi:hypothetical protein